MLHGECRSIEILARRPEDIHFKEDRSDLQSEVNRFIVQSHKPKMRISFIVPLRPLLTLASHPHTLILPSGVAESVSSFHFQRGEDWVIDELWFM